MVGPKEECTEDWRKGLGHETYLRSDRSLFCRACGKELGRLPQPEPKKKRRLTLLEGK